MKSGKKQKKWMQTATFGVPWVEMKGRVTYRPPIAPEQMVRLRLLKLQRGVPITQLVAEALDDYFANYIEEKTKGGDSDEVPTMRQED
jgi:hypothetical protein